MGRHADRLAAAPVSTAAPRLGPPGRDLVFSSQHPCRTSRATTAWLGCSLRFHVPLAQSIQMPAATRRIPSKHDNINRMNRFADSASARIFDGRLVARLPAEIQRRARVRLQVSGRDHSRPRPAPPDPRHPLRPSTTCTGHHAPHRTGPGHDAGVLAEPPPDVRPSTQPLWMHTSTPSTHSSRQAESRGLRPYERQGYRLLPQLVVVGHFRRRLPVH